MVHELGTHKSCGRWPAGFRTGLKPLRSSWNQLIDKPRVQLFLAGIRRSRTGKAQSYLGAPFTSQRCLNESLTSHPFICCQVAICGRASGSAWTQAKYTPIDPVNLKVSFGAQADTDCPQEKAQEKLSSAPATRQKSSGVDPLPSNLQESQQTPAINSYTVQDPASRLLSGQHAQPPSSMSAPLQHTATAADSNSIAPGAIPFDVQPSHEQIPFESSSSAAMLQRPPAVRHPISDSEAEPPPPGEASLSQPRSQDKPAGHIERHKTGEDRSAAGISRSVPAHVHGQEHDDGPMEEIQLHTDTESVSNDTPEDGMQQPNHLLQPVQPASAPVEASEGADSNGSFNMQKTSQAASAAVAEAIAAANRAVESTGMSFHTVSCCLARLVSLCKNCAAGRFFHTYGVSIFTCGLFI